MSFGHLKRIFVTSPPLFLPSSKQRGDVRIGGVCYIFTIKGLGKCSPPVVDFLTNEVTGVCSPSLGRRGGFEGNVRSNSALVQ